MGEYEKPLIMTRKVYKGHKKYAMKNEVGKITGSSHSGNWKTSCPSHV